MFPTPHWILLWRGKNIPGTPVVGKITKDFRLVPHPSYIRNEMEPRGQLSKKKFHVSPDFLLSSVTSVKPCQSPNNI